MFGSLSSNLPHIQVVGFTCNIFFVFIGLVADQDDENLYLILKFAGGGDLFSQLDKRRRLPEDAARFYISELILAIEALHKHWIAYRDLKPENVLLSLDGTIFHSVSNESVLTGDD